jgi:basic membrane lipoprotein Med (substrate-binding protein (PBP1-ABC) superfamily)
LLGLPLGQTLAFIAAALLVIACGEEPEPPPEPGFQVALLTPGSIRDAGWNQSAYEGLMAIWEQLQAEIAHQETRTPQEFEAGFRDFAARGFDLVIGHGFEFQDAAAKVAAEFPTTVFITTSGSTIRANVAPIVFELEQATYVLGYIGAQLSKTGRLGAIGGIEIPSVESTFLAFEAGARDARPDARVVTTYIGSWEDVAAAREATLAQIAAGADVLIHNADAAGLGFFRALVESPKVYGFGTNRDQKDLAPDSVLASAVLDVPRALLLVAREVQDGRFRPRSIRFGLNDDVVGIEWNEPLVSQRGGGILITAGALVDRIKSGAIVVPRVGF